MPPREIPLHGPLALDLVAVTRRFGDFTAVNAISLQVGRGEIFGFLGPNGAGKSTTIKMMCGILSPSEGDGFVGGLSIRTQAEQIKEQIGYMSQRFSLYEDLTVRENIAFYAGIYQLSPDATKTKMHWVLEMADLTDRADSRAGELSAGLRQRLALGCSLLHDPPVVFLDEPTAGVDPLNRRRFWKLIYELAEQGVTIFVTTHYMDEAAYCDRLAMIYHGSLIAVGTPAELQRSHASNGQIPTLEEVFVRLIEEYDQNQRHQEAVHEH
ncbi:MAG: ABC transporter ATP-binding protein [Trichlorobacter sp.]